jgi:F0F1-type ATP synthase gamma subunit
VLELAAEGNYYEVFSIVPSTLLDKLRQGNITQELLEIAGGQAG